MKTNREGLIFHIVIGLALSITGIILIAVGILWEMPDRILFSVLTAGIVLGWLGIFLLLAWGLDFFLKEEER